MKLETGKMFSRSIMWDYEMAFEIAEGLYESDQLIELKNRYEASVAIIVSQLLREKDPEKQLDYYEDGLKKIDLIRQTLNIA